MAAFAFHAAPLSARSAHPKGTARRSPPTLRRACAADAAAVGRFLQSLSNTSRRLRFHGHCDPQSAATALALCDVDGARHQAWLAWSGSGDDAVVVGEARFVVGDDEAGAAELAIAVADGWQGCGVADALMQQVLAAAARAGVRHLYGDVLDGNARMQAFMRRHGFDVDLFACGDVLRMRREVGAAHAGLRGAWARVLGLLLDLHMPARPFDLRP